MSTITEIVEIDVPVSDVPVSTAYNQWTRFESFPELRETWKKFANWTTHALGDEGRWRDP
jgi:hypothetical protein